MDFIDEVIDQIRKETSIGGNRRERIAKALQLLRDNSNNFKEPYAVSKGKLTMRTDGENLYFTDSQNKEQEIILSDEFRASFNTGITGTAELNTVPSATKYERWKIAMPGTYPNFIEKDNEGNNFQITITPKEFEENEITLSVTNGVAKKELSKKNNSKIENWSAKAYSKGRQVLYNGSLYEADSNTLATDIPNPKSSVWKEQVGTKFSVSVDIKVLFRYITSSGEFNGFDAYIGSDKILIKEGQSVKANLVGENYGNVALGVWNLDGSFRFNESKRYTSLTELNEYTFKADKDCYVAVSTLRSGENPIGNADIGSFIITSEDIDNEDSENAVPSLKNFNSFKENKKDETISGANLLVNQGRVNPEGTLDFVNDVRFSNLYYLNIGDKIHYKSSREWDGIVIFAQDKKSVLPTQRQGSSFDRINFDFYHTADVPCYLICQGGIDNAHLTKSAPMYVSKSDIDNLESKTGVGSAKIVNDLNSNNRTINIDVSAFKNGGYNNGSSVGWHERWRYTDNIRVPKGSFIELYAGTESYDPVNGGSNILIRVYETDNSTLKEVVGGQFTGMGTVTYQATSDCYVGFNSFNSSMSARATINMGKIYLTPFDGGGGSGGKGIGKFIPDVTSKNPRTLVEIRLTTTDPIPENKGQFMNGEGTIEYDGIKRTVYMEFEPQGSSSLAYAEKNWTIKYYTDSTKTKKLEFRMANLLPYNEYVWKANFIDTTHVRNIGALRIWEQMIQTRSGYPKRESDWNLQNKLMPDSMETGALCHVDGFPSVLYINDQFYGIGSHNIGKKNDNYDLLSNDETNIQIELGDAVNYEQLNSIEIRVPKTPSATTNTNIQKFALQAQKTGAAFGTGARAMFWDTNIVDFYLALEFFQLIDCVSRNSHIMSYNSFDKVFFTPYDWDSWASTVAGDPATDPTASVWDSAINVPEPTRNFWKVKVWGEYQNDIKSRYAYLRGCGVFSLDNFINIANGISIMYGRKLYAQDITRWSKPNDRPLQRLYSYLKLRIPYLDARFGYTQ